MRPARILYVLDTLAPCGTTDLVGHLATRLDRGRFEPQVLALRARGGSGEAATTGSEAAGVRRFREAGIPASTLRLDGDLPFHTRLRPLVARLRFSAIDIVHAQSRPADLWTTWAALAARVPVRLYSRQATYGGLSLSARLRYALTARVASRVVAPSDAVRRHLLRREGVPSGRIERIHDAIDLDALEQVAPAALRARLGIPERAPLVGCVASFVPRKGLGHVVDAAARLRERQPDVRYALVGEGPERGALERRIAAAGLSGCFFLPGFREDYADWIAACDVFVLPSLWEGFNLSLLTACALGRAVVATNLEANREILIPGVTGLLPTPARPVLDASDAEIDPGALADAIGSLLDDPARRERLGARARQHALARFGAQAMAARHEELYLRLLRRRRLPRVASAPAAEPGLGVW